MADPTQHRGERDRAGPSETARRLLWFVGLGAASLLVCGAAAFVFRELIFFILAH